MERAVVFEVACRFLAAHGHFRGLDKLPLAALVMRDVGPNVLLNFRGGNALLQFKDLLLSLLLFSVLSVASHS